MSAKKVKTNIKPTVAIIHDGGATFQFEPINGIFTAVIVGASYTNNGLKYYRHQEVGPWGNSDPSANDQREGYDLERKTYEDAAWVLVRALQEGNEASVFNGQIIDQRTIETD